jgi:plasmid stability protein
LPCPQQTSVRHSCTYTVYMKNITLSVDDEVLAAVRRYTAEHNSSVNALVREYLTNLAGHQDRARRARARLRQLSKRSQGSLGKKAWTRSDLHER